MSDVLEAHARFALELDVILTWNFYPIYALLTVFNQFDFYLHQKDYLAELLSIFDKSDQVQFMGEERNNLLRDKRLLCEQLPDVFRCGIFEVETRDVK
jgi:hypothetical protein